MYGWTEIQIEILPLRYCPLCRRCLKGGFSFIFTIPWQTHGQGRTNGPTNRRTDQRKDNPLSEREIVRLCGIEPAGSKSRFRCNYGRRDSLSPICRLVIPFTSHFLSARTLCPAQPLPTPHHSTIRSSDLFYFLLDLVLSKGLGGLS